MSDPCECIWSQEMAMRRLLSLLRQSQAYCVDNECLEEMPGGLPNTQGGSNSILLMAICWLAVALVLYFLRPASLRNRGDTKRRDTGFGSNGSPPSPPPAINWGSQNFILPFMPLTSLQKHLRWNGMRNPTIYFRIVGSSDEFIPNSCCVTSSKNTIITTGKDLFH